MIAATGRSFRRAAVPAAAALLALGALIGCGTPSTMHIDPRTGSAAVALRIGSGPRYRPPALRSGTRSGRPVGPFVCRRGIGRRALAHIELFANGRVIAIPSGIGVSPPWRMNGGRIVAGACSYPLATLEPTGLLALAPGYRLRLADLFALWGQALGRRRLCSFSGRPVAVYLDGSLLRGDPRAVPIMRGAQIVVEFGPHLPPHRSYVFPPTDH